MYRSAGVRSRSAGAATARPAGDIPLFLRHVWAFDRSRVTDEDTRRAELYAQRAERAKAERFAGSLEEFLESLQLEVEIASARTGAVAARGAAHAAHQPDECHQHPPHRSRDPDGLDCLVVTVRDRFGDYGLTGVMIVREQARRRWWSTRFC